MQPPPTGMNSMTGMISPHLPQLMGALYTPTRPYYNRMWHSWWVSSDADVRQVLSDDRLSATHGAAVDQLPGHGPLVAGIQVFDERRHLDLRRAVELPLRKTATGLWFVSIHEIANALLDRIVAKRSGEVLLVEEYTRPFAAYAMCLVLGLPHEAAPRVWAWLDEQIDVDAPTDPITLQARQWASWFALLSRRHAEPLHAMDGLVDYLLKLKAGRYRVAGRPMSDEDIAACCTSVMALGAASLAGGMATTLALLNESGRTDAVRADLSLVPDAVREALRCEPPLPTVRRRARTDLEVDGQLIRAGEWVTGSLLAANRDPTRFDDPDVFKLGRPHGEDLTFGLGEHGCPVQGLAEAELQVGLYELLRRLPGLKVDPTADLRRRWPALVPALVELPCRFDAAAALAVQQPTHSRQ